MEFRSENREKRGLPGLGPCCESNQASREARAGREGGGGIDRSFSTGERDAQSVRDQLGAGGGREQIGWVKIRETGT